MQPSFGRTRRSAFRRSPPVRSSSLFDTQSDRFRTLYWCPSFPPGQLERRDSLIQRKNLASCRYTMGFQPTVSSAFWWSLGEDDPDSQANTSDHPGIAEDHFGFLHDYFSRNRADAQFPQLTHVADQPEIEEPLTPNHFLLHRPYANLPPGVFDSSEQPLSFKSWKEIQKVTNHIWKRLLKEYLPTLHPRGKWSTAQPPLRVGDLVCILHDFTPRGIWPLGRIAATHPGRNGIVRVCTVKTAYGTFDRPAVSLSRVFAP